MLAREAWLCYFTTTLTISPLKNSVKLNEIGLKVAEETGTNYLLSEFLRKKKDIKGR